MKTYPAIQLFARHGRAISVALGVIVAVCAIMLFVVERSTVGLVAGLLSALLVFALVRVGAEIVEVISETLLPR